MRHAIYHFDTCQFVLPKMERMKDDVQIMRIQMGSLLIAYRNRRCARKKVKKNDKTQRQKGGMLRIYLCERMLGRSADAKI